MPALRDIPARFSSLVRRAAFPGWEFLLFPLLAVLAYRDTLGLYFQGDDWTLVGPRVAADFLANPLSIFTQTHGVHYQPVTFLLHGVSSALFGATAWPYHLLNVLLFGVALALLWRFLASIGLPPGSRALGVAVFGAGGFQYQVVQWISAGSYLVLAILLLLALSRWDRFLRERSRKDLLLAAFLVVLGYWTHSLAVVAPLALGLHWFCFAPDRRATLRPAALLVFALLALFLVLHTLPFEALFQGGERPRPSLDPLVAFQRIVGAAVFPRGLLPTVTGWYLFWPTPAHDRGVLLNHLLPALLLAILAAWLVRRTHVRHLLFGLSLMLAFWVPEAMYDGTLSPAIFRQLGRYYFFPSLGLAIAVAALAGPAWEWKGRLASQAGRGAVLLYLALLLANNASLGRDYRDLVAWQQGYVRSASGRFLTAVEDVSARSREGGCAAVTILDIPLDDVRPEGMRGGVALYHATHENFFRFFGLGGGAVRFEFIPYRGGSKPPPGECIYIARNGRLDPHLPPGRTPDRKR